MDPEDTLFFVLIVVTIILILRVLLMERQMEKFNQAMTRLQESVNKSNAKIDTLLAGTTAAVEAALSDAADKVNAVSDSLDTKNS